MEQSSLLKESKAEFQQEMTFEVDSYLFRKSDLDDVEELLAVNIFYY